MSEVGWYKNDGYLQEISVSARAKFSLNVLNLHFANGFQINSRKSLEGDVILKAAFGKLQTTQNRSTAFGPATPGTELYGARGDVLAKYSRCNLAFASDRAVAFAGIAKFFKALVDDNYVAGLWLRNLASEMMWFRHRLLTKAVVEEPRDRLCLFQHNQAHQYRASSFRGHLQLYRSIEPNHAKGNSGFLVAVNCVKFRDTQNAFGGKVD